MKPLLLFAIAIDFVLAGSYAGQGMAGPAVLWLVVGVIHGLILGRMK